MALCDHLLNNTPIETCPTHRRHPSSQRFHDILKGLGNLHDKKQASYGTDDDPFNNYRATAKEWGLPDWVMVMIRAAEKVKRLAALRLGSSLRAAESPPDGEGIAETLDDIAVLAVIARVMYEEEKEGEGYTCAACGEMGLSRESAHLCVRRDD